jgi:hypothetical protein
MMWQLPGDLAYDLVKEKEADIRKAANQARMLKGLPRPRRSWGAAVMAAIANVLSNRRKAHRSKLEHPLLEWSNTLNRRSREELAARGVNSAYNSAGSMSWWRCANE